MKINFKILVTFFILNFSDVLGEEPIVAEESTAQVTTFLLNLDTDLTSLVNRIPNPLKLFNFQSFLQPVLGLYGNVVESVIDNTGANARRSAIGKLDKVRFLLYSNRNVFNNESFTHLVPEDDESIRNANFTSARPIKILIHGFQAAGFYAFPQRAKNAYLRSTNFNVIVVDWGSLSYPPLSNIRWLFTYPSSVNNMMFVSRRVADLVVALQRNNITTSPDDIHLIGFSLGAHVSGQAGLSIERRLGSKIGRITAIDPASPLIQAGNLQMTIDQSDAKFVDVIHASYVSFYNPIGHADFFLNGGKNQPQCYDGINSFENLIQAFLDYRNQCTHSFAYELFTASISNQSIIGCRCQSWADYRNSCKNNCQSTAVVGEYCPPTTRGQYYLETTLPIEVLRPAGPISFFGWHF